MTRLRQILSGGFNPEEETAGESYRDYLVGVYIYPFAFIAHLAFFLLFLFTGITPMWIFNTGSMLLFIAAYFLNRRRSFLTAFTLGYLEVILHACTATLLIGWFAGFHYFIFVAGAGAYFVTIRNRRFRFSLTVLAAAAYIWLALQSRTVTPSYTVDPELFFYVNLSIIAGTFVALGFLANYQNKATLTIEDRLEEERSKLERQNESIKNELKLARNIQLQNIPSVSPYPWLSFLYKPMQLLGGDFFDFVLFPSGRLGIFLSDVSGHGVPAALVTSIMKSYTLQHALADEDPAGFLSGLNGFLKDRTGGNFVTAFYGILDRETGNLVYANAGHNPPLLMAGDTVERIQAVTNSPPLNVLSNRELEIIGKSFCNEYITLQRGSRLLLYTDGLTEAISLENGMIAHDRDVPDFETDQLEKTLFEHRRDNPEKLIRNLMRSLVAYRGEDHFEDDICLICLDI